MGNNKVEIKINKIKLVMQLLGIMLILIVTDFKTGAFYEYILFLLGLLLIIVKIVVKEE